MAFFSSKTEPKAAAAAVLASSLQQEIKDSIAQELALANATELVSKITENCFDKCIQQPGPSLNPTEDGCVTQCLEKYMRSWNVISKSYINRIQESGSNSI